MFKVSTFYSYTLISKTKSQLLLFQLQGLAKDAKSVKSFHILWTAFYWDFMCVTDQHKVENGKSK